MKDRAVLHLILEGLFLAVALPLFSAPAYGQMDSYLGIGAGVFNVMDSNSGVYGLIDYRPPFGIYGIGTWITLSATEDQAGYFSAGILKDFYLSKSFVLTPSFGIGIYNRAEEELVLGHPVEFRSALKLSYELEDKSRIGVRFGHVSNADLGETNPGSEFLSLIYSIHFNSQ
ncbi:MAG: acyloxyacyl hydrolase [Desulfohalobiaceae bacterium]